MTTLFDVFLPDTLVIKSIVSEDGQIANSNVQSFQVALARRPSPAPPGQLSIGRSLGDPPVVASQVASVFLPFNTDQENASINITVRGFKAFELGAHGMLYSRIAGTNFIDELDTLDDQFEISHTVNIHPLKGVLITFLLLVDRKLTDGGLPDALASIDSVEFALV